jgi:hypothetical protein
MATRSLAWLAAALSIALVACRNREPPVSAIVPVAPSSASNSAHPAPFVHPPTPTEPTPPQARPECSYEALVPVAARIHEEGDLAFHAIRPTRKQDRALRCGSPAMAELDHLIKNDLADRVRICVGQDGPLDPEWNLLDAALASLGACIDCSRSLPNRTTDCRHTADQLAQAQSEAAKNQPPKR